MNTIDIQGHRGCRGLLPENTIPAFQHALDLGVNTLELDVVISKDKVVVVSHEPFLNHDICQDLSGNRIKKTEEHNYNIYQINFDQLIKYDCGLETNPRFLEQKKIPSSKPSLDEMIIASEKRAEDKAREAPKYNIEIKRTKKGDLIFHPEYKEFTDLVLDVIYKHKIQERTTVQCFDLEVLQYMKSRYPDQAQVLLVENKKPIDKNIQELGHIPEVYSPNFRLIDKETVDYCKKHKMKLIPWTVNEEQQMIKMIKLGVDGIITDYPDRLINLKSK